MNCLNCDTNGPDTCSDCQEGYIPNASNTGCMGQ